MLLVTTALAGAGVLPAAEPDLERVNAFPIELPQLLGAESAEIIGTDDTLLDVAVRTQVGYDALVRLNPEVDAWMPKQGSQVALPTRMIPPNAPQRGIVINIPEMRLYDYTRGAESEGPEVFPIAVGDPTSPTPVGSFRVLWKTTDPVWTVPDSIRAENPRLPASVPPGEDNPLGGHWMALGNGYGIHGTNNRWSIGRVATHGCIRLQNEQVERLYARIPVGTPVAIVYQTVKLGRDDLDLYVEVHPDLYDRVREPLSATLVHLMVLGLLGFVDRDVLADSFEQARGVPVRIGRLPGPRRPSESVPIPGVGSRLDAGRLVERVPLGASDLEGDVEALDGDGMPDPLGPPPVGAGGRPAESRPPAR